MILKSVYKIIYIRKDKLMNKVKKELEVLKSWGIERVPVDKVLNMIKEVKDGSKISPMGQHMETLSKTVSATPVGGTIFLYR